MHKRFRVRQDGAIVFSADTTREVYDWLRLNPSVYSAYIEDPIDDIDWVTEAVFKAAFEEGENYQDLQAF